MAFSLMTYLVCGFAPTLLFIHLILVGGHSRSYDTRSDPHGKVDLEIAAARTRWTPVMVIHLPCSTHNSL
jgi:hypothetical protein